MATTHKVVFHEIGLGVLQFCCAYSLFIRPTLHDIAAIYTYMYITTAATAAEM